MVFDKNFGQWNLKNASELDDYAFHFYLQDMLIKYDDARKRHFSQQLFKLLKSSEVYYNQSNIILRREKIKKILNHGKENR